MFVKEHIYRMNMCELKLGTHVFEHFQHLDEYAWPEVLHQFLPFHLLREQFRLKSFSYEQ